MTRDDLIAALVAERFGPPPLRPPAVHRPSTAAPAANPPSPVDQTGTTEQEGAPMGEDLDHRCCSLTEGHDGPCEWQCSECEGTGRCPACDGEGGIELCSPCELCDGTGACPDGCYEGRQVEDLPWIPQRAGGKP